MANLTAEGLSPSSDTQEIIPLADSTQPWYNRPHDELVGDIQKVVAAERAKQEAKGVPFDPVFWVGDLLTRSALSATGTARENRLELSNAWDAISQPFVRNPDYRQALDTTLLTSTAMRRSNTVILTPPAAKLIRAMADAVGVPFDHKQTTIDLLPTPQRKQLFRNVYTTIAKETGI